MNTMRSGHTSRSVLAAALCHVEATLQALEDVTMRPHRAASATLVLASLMDDVAVRAELVMPTDRSADDCAAQLVGSAASLQLDDLAQGPAAPLIGSALADEGSSR